MIDIHLLIDIEPVIITGRSLTRIGQQAKATNSVCKHDGGQGAVRAFIDFLRARTQQLCR